MLGEVTLTPVLPGDIKLMVHLHMAYRNANNVLYNVNKVIINTLIAFPEKNGFALIYPNQQFFIVTVSSIRC